MRLRRNVVASIRALSAQRLRWTLALSSVSIGVAAVILTSAIGAGASREVERSMDAMGSNLIVVRPAQVQRFVARKPIRGFVTTLEVDDCDAIARLPFVVATAPGAERPVRAKAGNDATVTKVLGTSPAYLSVRNARVRSGRFFDHEDDWGSRRVAVLGFRVAEALFEEADPLGSEIRVLGVPFEVIGVLESKGAMPDGSDEDNQILIPITTALRRVLNTTWLTSVFVSVNDRAAMDTAAEGIEDLVRARHARSDFSVQNTTKFVSMQSQVASFLTKLATGLGVITLAVGGTGILALMMMSVKERTPEIGLRMAIGATPNDVLVQFLFECTLLASAGWVLGIAISGAGAIAVSLVTEWTLAVPFDALLASAAMVLVAGLGFGAFPARKASMMTPIAALQSR
ncbi:MAG: ABC transporter permease [Acidobacteria bacterium]|nr:ABC transporter permease [Acidobacteriota bacterium]